VVSPLKRRAVYVYGVWESDSGIEKWDGTDTSRGHGSGGPNLNLTLRLLATQVELRH